MFTDIYLKTATVFVVFSLMFQNKLKSRDYFLIVITVAFSITLIFGKTHSLQAQTNSPTVPVVVASRFELKPEKREFFLDVATKAIEPSRAEPGNISYSFYEDPNVPNSFIYFEEWKSHEALKEHLQQPYTKAVVGNFSDLVQGEVDVKVYDIKALTTKL